MSMFQHHEVMPFIFLCLAPLNRAVSLHLKCLMNPLGFYLSMPFVAASQGQPQANWCHLIVKADFFLFFFLSRLYQQSSYSATVCFPTHRDSLLSALTYDIMSERQLIRVWNVGEQRLRYLCVRQKEKQRIRVRGRAHCRPWAMGKWNIRSLLRPCPVERSPTGNKVKASVISFTTRIHP